MVLRRSWRALLWLLCAAIGIAGWATQVAPDDLVAAVCKWFALYHSACPGWVDASNIPKITPYLFYAGALAVALYILWPKFFPKNRRETGQASPTTQEALPDARGTLEFARDTFYRELPTPFWAIGCAGQPSVANPHQHTGDKEVIPALKMSDGVLDMQDSKM